MFRGLSSPFHRTDEFSCGWVSQMLNDSEVSAVCCTKTLFGVIFTPVPWSLGWLLCDTLNNFVSLVIVATGVLSSGGEWTG